jgi:hypothetical protein
MHQSMYILYKQMKEVKPPPNFSLEPLQEFRQLRGHEWIHDAFSTSQWTQKQGISFSSLKLKICSQFSSQIHMHIPTIYSINQSINQSICTYAYRFAGGRFSASSTYATWRLFRCCAPWSERAEKKVEGGV